MAKSNKDKGNNLSLYDKVYRELDRTFIGAERQRNVKAANKERYDYIDEICTDGEYIIVHSDTNERLNLAQRIAEYYNASFIRLEEPWRRDPKYRFSIKIATS